MQAIDYSPIWISLKTTLIATAVTVVCALTAAWLVAGMKHKKWKAVIDAALTIPLVLPPTVMGFFLLYVFGINRPLGKFFYDTFGIKIAFSFTATVISAAVVAFPLMYRSARAGFEQLDKNLIEEAKMLGLGSFRILWQIQIPCALPSVVSGTVLAMTRGMGEYGATAMLAGNIAGKTRTLPLAVYSEVAAGHMERAWVYVAAILAVALWAVCMMNLFAERDAWGKE